MIRPLDIIILGLSITSSWGNGHATTFRSLVHALSRRGHRVLFLERDKPWYAAHRDLQVENGSVQLYNDLEELDKRFSPAVAAADLVIVGSFVPEGIAVGEWVTSIAHGVTAFYDIDTPVTLTSIARGECAYLSQALIPRYQLYLSFTGGPILRRIEKEYGAAAALPLYCSVDPEVYRPAAEDQSYDLGYMGTYSPDRQPALEQLLLQPARQWEEGRFTVAGPQYPRGVPWPENVARIEHLPPSLHCAFYNSQRFTLNLTRADMVRVGYSPSIRIFEAAACGIPVISDYWDGLETVFAPDEEILIAQSAEDVLRYMRDLPDSCRLAIGLRARKRVLAEHTAARRAALLEKYFRMTPAGQRSNGS